MMAEGQKKYQGNISPIQWYALSYLQQLYLQLIESKS